MDWLLDRQRRIETALARRHLAGEGFVLYDLSSSYLEGRQCELGAIGYSRDGQKGKLQITYGLVCAPSGHPVSVEVHPGNTGDPTTLGPAVERVKDTFGIEHVVFVGDRGMITQARVKVLKEQGVGFITALRAPQIQALTIAPHFQLSLFDEQGLCEVTSPEFPGERLVVCRNPQVAAERARKRQDLLAATERELDKVCQMVDSPRGRLHGAPGGPIGERAGRIVNKHKMAKHFTLHIADGSFRYQRNHAHIDQEALLDGIYVVRTDQPQQRIGSAAVVRAYKQLKVNERAIREMKTPLEIRPIYHRLADRVRAHVFLCLLAATCGSTWPSAWRPCCSPMTRRWRPPTRSPPPNAHPRPSRKPAATPPTVNPPTASPTCSLTWARCVATPSESGTPTTPSPA
jgi:hypothetical protein